MSAIAYVDEPLQNAFRHDNQQMRAWAHIASDPDMPADDSAAARRAIVTTLDLESGKHVAIPCPVSAHLELETRLVYRAATIRKSNTAEALAKKILAAIPTHVRPRDEGALAHVTGASVITLMAATCVGMLVLATPVASSMTQLIAAVAVLITTWSAWRPPQRESVSLSGMVAGAFVAGLMTVTVACALTMSSVFTLPLAGVLAFSVGGMLAMFMSIRSTVSADTASMLRLCGAIAVVGGDALLSLT